MEVVAPGVGAAVADRFLLLEITVQEILPPQTELGTIRPFLKEKQLTRGTTELVQHFRL
jgi:hypothetical protein